MILLPGLNTVTDGFKACALTVWGADGLVSRTADCWAIQRSRSRWPHLEEKRRTQIRSPQRVRPLTLFPLSKHDQNIPASQHPGNYTHSALSCSQEVNRGLHLNRGEHRFSLNCTSETTLVNIMKYSNSCVHYQYVRSDPVAFYYS